MFINHLKIHNFRNIIEKHLDFDNNINIFHGENGVGKTSILESIYYLSSGKSFRKGNYKSLINFNSDAFNVYIKCSSRDADHIFSVNKNNKGLWKAKHNNEVLKKQSFITQIFPVVSIDPEVYQLVDFGPLYRRSFLDWLVFHVKHDYLLLWKKTNKCIKQLNILYKQKASNDELDLWEESLIKFTHQLNQIRIEIFNLIKPIILDLSEFMQEEIPHLDITYKQGWLDNNSYHEQLIIDREKNLKYGQLQSGPHKMDIKISTGSIAASHTLSRGQKKVLSITFYMAYIHLLNKHNITPILCLDDFDAELDENKLIKAANFFNNSDTQIFITSVQQKKITRAFPSAAMFHVKQ